MRLRDWFTAALDAALPPLADPPSVPLYPHQELGARRILGMLERVGGALLLDDVGMGKSFTAATVMRDAAARGVPSAVLAPKHLLDPWAKTLARFGIEAPIGSHDAAGSFPVPDGPARLLIVDEAHRFRNPATRRYGRLARASPGRALLLITATPLCNRLEELRVLIRLAIADDALRPWGIPSIDAHFDRKDLAAVREILARVSIRRSPAGEELRFPASTRRVVRFTLGEGAEDVAAGIRRLRVPLLARGQGPELLRRHLWRRYESSPEALRASLRRQAKFYRRAREKMLAGFELTRRDFAALFDSEDDFYQELLFPQIFLAKTGGDPASVEEELGRIESLVALSRKGEPEKPAALAALLGDDSLRPALVFTSAVATAARIRDLLSVAMRAGMASAHITRDASGAASTLQELLADVRARRLDALVLTDLAAEGLDVQAAASVVHYDLPWTEVKVRQRSGRAIRIGQVRAEVPLVFFLPERGARRGPIRVVSRKRRLADAVLVDDPIPAPRRHIPLAGSGAVRVGNGFASVVQGAACLCLDGVRTCDPKTLAAAGDEEVASAEGMEPAALAQLAGAEVPPRVLERDPYRALLDALVRTRRVRDLGLRRVLEMRFRSGVEIVLHEADCENRGGWDGIVRREDPAALFPSAGEASRAGR